MFARTPLFLPLVSVLLLFACTPNQREETDADGFRTVYTVDPETGEMDGRYTQYAPDGSLYLEENYVAGVLQGERTIYQPNGRPALVETYVDGEFEGPYTSYDSLGNLAFRGDYIDGKMAGVWTYYYDNGLPREAVTFADNKENGPFREWNYDGNPAAAGSYKGGDKEDGLLWLFLEATTELDRVLRCDTGICQTVWTPDSLSPAPTPPNMELPLR